MSAKPISVSPEASASSHSGGRACATVNVARAVDHGNVAQHCSDSRLKPKGTTAGLII